MEFLNKQEQADLGVLEEQESPIEDQLESENITIDDIHIDVTEESYISAEQKEFSRQEREQIADFDDQNTEVINDNTIVSQFEESISIPDDASGDDILTILEDNLLYSEEYVFGDWNNEMNVLIFFQEKNEQPVYYNRSGIVLVFLDEENNMEFYTQTILEEAESQGDSRSLIQPIRAVEALYTNNELYPDEAITSMDIGFYTRVPLENNEHVFAPTYKITLDTRNDEQEYFVNAIEGTVLNSRYTNFLDEPIESIVSNIETLDDDSEIKHDVLERMEPMLDEDNGVN